MQPQIKIFNLSSGQVKLQLEIHIESQLDIFKRNIKYVIREPQFDITTNRN